MARLFSGQVLGLAISFLAATLLAGPIVPAVAFVVSQPTITVSAVDHRFMPENLQTATGAKIVWTNNGTVPHTVTSDTGLWESVVLAPGQAFARLFDSPGSYGYHCEFHAGAGMVGLITVAGAALATPTGTVITGTLTPLPTAAATTPGVTPTPLPTPASLAPTPTPLPALPAVPTATPVPSLTPFPRALPATGEPRTVPWIILSASLVIIAGALVRILGRD